MHGRGVYFVYEVKLVLHAFLAMNYTDKLKFPKEIFPMSIDPLSQQSDIASVRYEWFKEYEKCSNVNEVCKRFGISRKTFYKWLKRFKESGKSIHSLTDHARTPLHSPNQTCNETQKLVLALRVQTGSGPRKIREKLAREYNISLSERTIWKIFQRAHSTAAVTGEPAEQYVNPDFPGHVVQVGVLPITLYAPGFHFVQYTALDSVTRLCVIKLYPRQSTLNALDFVQYMQKQFPFPLRALQTKVDTTFTSIIKPGDANHAFTMNVEHLGYKHIVTTPNSPFRNRKLDRTHRVDMKEFYSKYIFQSEDLLMQQFIDFLEFYNNKRKASELGNKTPIEVLRSYDQYKTIESFKAA